MRMQLRIVIGTGLVLHALGFGGPAGRSAAWGAVPVKPPEPQRIELKTADGQTIAGFWVDAHDPARPAVLLLHNAGYDHFPYRALWERLLRLGVNVLAVDFRGHGASQRTTPEAYERLAAHDESVCRDFLLDARAGLDFLTRIQKIPASRIAVVGGEVGATVGFQLLAANQSLRGLVALSPQTLSHGIDVMPLLPKFGKRPLLLVSSKKLLHEGPQRIADELQKTATVQLEVYPGAEVRGVEMLNQPSAVERLILIWVREHLLGEKNPG